MYSVRNTLRPRHLCLSSHLRPSKSHTVQLPRPSRRCVHSVRELPYKIDEGLGEFLSPAALRMLAVEYQQGLLTRLNEQVKGTEMENETVVQTVISSAAHRRHALTFNYASQALNNSFFLQYLKPPTPPHENNEHEMTALMEEIRLNFGSLAQLKSTFSAAAMGMVNSGWVWLVSDENGHMQVVGTFGAGTLLVRSRRHMLEDNREPILGEPHASVRKGTLAAAAAAAGRVPPSQGTPSVTSPASGLQRPPPGLSPSTPSRSLHTSSLIKQENSGSKPHVFLPPSSSSRSTLSSREPNFDDIGDILTPLLCVSVQEHAWVGTGYGVWGKEEYLKRFWTVVDWLAVERAFKKAREYK